MRLHEGPRVSETDHESATSDPASRTVLEDRFRSLLRVLPRYYRAGRAEEMVDTFLSEREPLDEEAALSRPGVREVAGILLLAVRSRLAADGAPQRYAAYGRTARLVALLGIVAQTAMVLVNRVVEVALLLAGDSQSRSGVRDGYLGGAPAEMLWNLPAALLPLGWVGACIALSRGRWRVATVFAVLATVPVVGDTLRMVGTGLPFTWGAVGHVVFACLVATATAAGFHPGAPRVEVSRNIRGALPLAAFVLSVLMTVVAYVAADGSFEWTYGWLFLAGGGLCLVSRIPGVTRLVDRVARRLGGTAPHAGWITWTTDPALPAAFAVIGVPLFVTEWTNLGVFWDVGFSGTALVVNTAQLFVALAVELALVVFATSIARYPRTGNAAPELAPR